MIELVENDKIGTIIVKDLSRLGREYLQTGYYTDVVFNEHNVRFIAINDNVDTDMGDNEFAPFKNIMNEWYAKDCSRKVKSAFRAKALNGEYTGGYPAYGYMKSPDDRHKLIPDKNAPIVKRMFQMALEGASCYHVAKTLENEQISTPRAYLMNEYGKYVANERVKRPYAWHKSTVHQILSNPVCLGKLVSCRYQTKSFKDKRIIPRPKEDWITVDNTHEALVDELTFDYLSYIVNEIHSTIVATVDDEGFPVTCAIDMMDADSGSLYFLTAKGKNFYNRLKERKFLALTAMKGEDTMTSVAVSIRGKVREIGNEKIPYLFEKNKYMNEIYPTEISRQALTVFQIYEGGGEWFDLSKKPIERANFSFGNNKAEQSETGYFITDSCIGCGVCLEVCPQKCINLSDTPAIIAQEHCLHCSNCMSVCPVGAVVRI